MTAKKTKEQDCSTATKSKKDVTCSTTTSNDKCDFNFIEISDSDKDDCLFGWDGTVLHNEKQKLATDILMRLLDFNLRQLSREDVNTVGIFENPAKYAAELTNELFNNIE